MALNHWAHQLRGHIIRINCDNMAVIQIINVCRTNDPILGMCIRNLLWTAVQNNIHVLARHISGHHTVVADALSRLIQDPTGNALMVTASGVNLQWLERESLFS